MGTFDGGAERNFCRTEHTADEQERYRILME